MTDHLDKEVSCKDARSDMNLTERNEDGLFGPLGLPIQHIQVDNLAYSPVCSAENVKNRNLFTPRDDDCLVATFPRSGTTWTLELVRNIHLVQNPDLEDGHPLRSLNHFSSAPWINLRSDLCKGFPDLDEKAGPRIMKTHNHYQHLNVPFGNTEFKIIHVMRDPRDVICSMYNRMTSQTTRGYKGTFDEFLGQFLRGKMVLGGHWSFNKQYLENKDGFNILYLTYEELTNDKTNAIQKISNFLGYSDISPDQIELVNKPTQFKTMKGSQSSLDVSLAGKTGSYKVLFDVNQVQRIVARTSLEFSDVKDKVPMSYFNL